MSQFTQRGFVACRKIGGGEPVLKLIEVSAVANEAYFIGDAVTLGASGKCRPLKAASTTAPLGVIQALFSKSNNRPKPLALNLPTNGPFLTSGTAGYALVNVDPNQTYVVQLGGNVVQAGIGAAYKVSAGAPNTSTGLSGQELGSTASTSADADAQWQIVGFAPVEWIEANGFPTSIAAKALVEVKMVGGIFGGNPV